MILDDTTLHSWIPGNHEPTDFEVFSPVVAARNMSVYSHAVHEAFVSERTSVFTADFVEFFVEYMTVNGFKRYLEFFSTLSPWMWYMELLVKPQMGLDVVLFNDWIVNHWKKGQSYSETQANGSLVEFFALFGLDFWHELEKAKHVQVMPYSLSSERRNYPAKIVEEKTTLVQSHAPLAKLTYSALIATLLIFLN
jgi:hypothetical protein